MSEKKTYENDYSLLRPFDLEAAKSGAAICMHYGDIVKLIAGPDAAGDFCVLPDGGEFGFPRASMLRMAPLGWVEGRPVYKGDVLYRPIVEGDKPLIASHVEQFGGCGHLGFENSPGREFADNRRGYLTWEKPNSVLCEVEGKPVRKGDRLYGKWEGSRPDGYEIAGLDHLGRLVSTFGFALADDHGRLTWDKPKPVKRWINVYADKYGDLLHETKDAADAAVSRHRLACIEIELPPLAEVAK